VRDVAEDDGIEVRHVFDLEAELHNRMRRFSVPAAQFSSLNWAIEQLGAGAITARQIVFFAQGNASGRQRMQADGTLRPVKPPRGLVLSTGEDTPRGQSLRSRLFVLEVDPSTVNWERVTACQLDAGARTLCKRPGGVPPLACSQVWHCAGQLASADHRTPRCCRQ
jgi:hypothetical protein